MQFILKILLLTVMILCTAERITYLSVEHAIITYRNPKYISYFKTTARRMGRADPVYYYNLNISTLIYFDNNMTFDFYFYEFLTNQYKRSFVEMHFKFCDLIHKDKFFGAAMNKAGLNKPCPYPPGTYILSNMTVPSSAIPRGFPFTKGRIYCNITWTPINQIIAAGYVDMELKQLRKRGTNNTN